MINANRENLNMSFSSEKVPEVSAPEVNPVIEQKENSGIPKQAEEIPDVQAARKSGELKNAGESPESSAEISRRDKGEAEKNAQGGQKTVEKANIGKEEYENSFITPGVIESQAEEKNIETKDSGMAAKNDNKDKNRDKKEPVLDLCPECGKDKGPGSSFCMSCGSGILKSDRMKKIAREAMPNMDDKSRAISIDHYRRTTEELKEEYPDTIGDLEAVAKDIGFKNLYIKDFETINAASGRASNNIHVESNNYGKDAVFFPKRYLKNHQLLSELDERRTNLGLRIVMEHEKEHCEDHAKKAARVGTAIETKEEYRDHVSRVAKEINLDTDEIRKQLEALSKRNTKLIESQVGTQLIVKGTGEVDYKDKKEMVNQIVDLLAATGVYLDGLETGIDGFKSDLKSKNGEVAKMFYENHYRGLSKKIIKDIINREKEIKEDYIDRYNEKYGIIDNEANK